MTNVYCNIVKVFNILILYQYHECYIQTFMLNFCCFLKIYTVRQQNPDSHRTMRVRILLPHSVHGPLMSNVYHRIFYENVSAKCIVKHFELRIITDMGTPIKTHPKICFYEKIHNFYLINETLSKQGTHEYLILTKFCNDWVKIVDFLITCGVIDL